MAKKEKEVKNKKNGHYFKDMKAELKKVVWPNRKQLVNNTVAVIVFTLILAVIVFVLDLCFDSINKYGVTPLQEKITSSYNASNTEESSEENENEDVNSDEETPTETSEEDGEEIEITTESDSEE